MNSNFNRQFILTDFRLLENRAFLEFIGTHEYATYLILRRYVWRSSKPHFMGLHTFYRDEHQLASSIGRDKISEISGIDADNISRHLSRLEKRGIVKRIRTGRQNIYVLGEWVDVHGNGRYREVEWFYLDGAFGVSKADLTLSVSPDPTISSDQTPRKATAQSRRQTTDQTRRQASDNNREGNKKENTTVDNGELIRQLPELEIDKAQIDDIVERILEVMGDHHSKRFYRLVASRVPKENIFEAIAEIKADGADSAPKTFTHRMGRFALAKLRRNIG